MVFLGGHAKYTVTQNNVETKVVVSGRYSFVDLFFKVRNRYETIINNPFVPRYFKRNNIEGGSYQSRIFL